MSHPNKKLKQPQHTLLDRSIPIVLPHPDPTPSARNGISCATERLHRLFGTSLIWDACQLLELSKEDSSSCVYATACTIFHRFYHCISLRQYNVWSSSMACTLLAAKSMDVPLTVKRVIHVFGHVYRRRRLVLVEDVESILPHASVAASPSATLPLDAKQTILRNHIPTMSALGPVYQEWYDCMTTTENVILRHLGFCLYWISDSHPHPWIRYILSVNAPSIQKQESTENDKALIQRAWNYCNDACRLDLCVRFEAKLIACAAVYLATLDCAFRLPDRWWRDVCCTDKETDNDVDSQLSTCANAILGILQSDESKVASSAFVVSCVEGGSFNDPGSYLWEESVKKDDSK